MHLLRYDHGYSRRAFLQRTLQGAAGAGLLMPLWQAIAATGSSERAYPEELRSIEAWSRGRIKPGDEIHAGNVELVRELLEPVKYQQVKTMGRRLKVAATTHDVLRLSPWDYLEASLRNAGRARFDARGNVVTDAGKPWIGGNPFPEFRNGLELFASLTLSWGRHDACLYAFREYDLGPEGEVSFQYEGGWVEMSAVARLRLDPKPYWTGHEEKLRYQSVFFTGPNAVRGTSYLNIWPYDHHTFPELYGYLPEFKRVRRFPTNQRFEPLVPGSAMYLSDAWAAGDPLHTWGNYRIVGRGPLLAAVSGGWNAEHPNWEHRVHGGPKGKSFWDTTVELVPEAVIVEAEPIRFPRAPVSRKRVWFDARTQLPIGMLTYDRRGEPYRSFDGAYALYEQGSQRVMDGRQPYWSWGHVHAYELQTGRMTRLEQVKSVNGHRTSVNDPAVYERYLTRSAMTALGG